MSPAFGLAGVLQPAVQPVFSFYCVVKLSACHSHSDTLGAEGTGREAVAALRMPRVPPSSTLGAEGTGREAVAALRMPRVPPSRCGYVLERAWLQVVCEALGSEGRVVPQLPL